MHRAKLIRSVLKPLLEGYEIGIAFGDTHSAFYDAYGYGECSLYCRVALTVIEESLATYTAQMRDFGQMNKLYGSLMTFQVVKILRGEKRQRIQRL